MVNVHPIMTHRKEARESCQPFDVSLSSVFDQQTITCFTHPVITTFSSLISVSWCQYDLLRYQTINYNRRNFLGPTT